VLTVGDLRPNFDYPRAVLILALIGFGMFCGWIAQVILGRNTRETNWAMALVSGLVGSFVGGLLFSLIAGDGLDLKASGFIGSILGAVVVTAIWQWFSRRSASA
jgi:uncharacterized membrane protein YeaQ/YmgE (transglycosylase-associated protein family)